jgi:subtilase family serine protease
MRIAFSGTAATVGAAFGSTFHAYAVDGDLRIATDGVPRIPAALSGVIRAVRGLATVDEKPLFRGEPGRASEKLNSTIEPDATFCSGGSCSHYVLPADFATIYDVNPVYLQGIDGTGQTIAVIGRSRVYLPDISNFQSKSNLPQKDPLTIVPTNGVDPGPALSSGGNPSEDQGEATLDVTRATSVAPGATIALVISAKTATSGGIDVASEHVVDSSPVLARVMSISYLGCEDSGSAASAGHGTASVRAAAEDLGVRELGDPGGRLRHQVRHAAGKSDRQQQPHLRVESHDLRRRHAFLTP